MQTLPVESCGRDASQEGLEASSKSKRATVQRPDAGRSADSAADEKRDTLQQPNVAVAVY